MDDWHKLTAIPRPSCNNSDEEDSQQQQTHTDSFQEQDFSELPGSVSSGTIQNPSSLDVQLEYKVGSTLTGQSKQDLSLKISASNLSENVFASDGSNDTNMQPGGNRADFDINSLFASPHSGEFEDGILYENGSNNSVCRICQLSEKESDAVLERTGCECKGELSRVHLQCLQEWIDSRANNTCEICKDSFILESNTQPNAPSEDNQGRIPHAPLASLHARLLPCREKRRVWFFILVCLQVIAMICCIQLHNHANAEWMRFSLSRDYDIETGYGESSLLADELRHLSHVAVYTFLFTFGMFSVTILIWMYYENKMHPRQLLYADIMGEDNTPRARARRNTNNGEIEVTINTIENEEATGRI